jgi:hypothetical protein
MSGDREAERALGEAARALEATDLSAAARAIARAARCLAEGPAPADLELLLFAHARLVAFAGGETARLAAELASLDAAHSHPGRPVALQRRSSIRSRATA